MANTTSTRSERIDTPAKGRYRLDPVRSSVTFRTRHLFGLARVKGTVPIAAGEVVVDPAGPDTAVAVTLDAAGFTTGHDRRDRDVGRRRFLDSDRYPRMTFRAFGFEALQRSGATWTVGGELTVRNVTRPVTLSIGSVEATGIGSGFRATATARIDRYAFGVTAARGLAARHLSVDLVAIAEPY